VSRSQTAPFLAALQGTWPVDKCFCYLQTGSWCFKSLRSLSNLHSVYWLQGLNSGSALPDSRQSGFASCFKSSRGAEPRLS
jgi:hypothetical protein